MGYVPNPPKDKRLGYQNSCKIERPKKYHERKKRKYKAWLRRNRR
jgi:hypothetical protein